MNEKVDSLFGTVNRVPGRVANVLYDSALFVKNASGRPIGYAGRAANSVFNVTRQLVGFSTRKSAGLFTGGLRKKTGFNKDEVQAKIAMLDNKIRDLYLEIGRIGSSSEDVDGLLATDEVKDIIAQIRKCEDESKALLKYLSALEESRQPGVPITKLLIKSRADFEGRATRRVRAAVERSIKKAQFTLRSDAIIFEKSLLDLLNAEMDIKLLAVSELGRLGSLHAGPVLKEALSMNSPELQAEIINALIQIEDKEVFALCKRFFKHDYAGVRTACIRGLYKAGQSESVPLLIEALKDENVEARNSAAIFLGWLEAKPAVPALLQTAAGEDLRVRKSSIMSLANIRDDGSVLPLIRFLNEDSREIRDMIIGALEKITGETLEFESDGADKQDRLESIERLKEWWIKKKYEMPDGYGAAAQAPGEQNADAREGEEATKAGALSKDPETH